MSYQEKEQKARGSRPTGEEIQGPSPILNPLLNIFSKEKLKSTGTKTGHSQQLLWARVCLGYTVIFLVSHCQMTVVLTYVFGQF